jgi:hypothetical protein
MKALASHKQLLIAESELNRAHLIHEAQTMAGEVHTFARQAGSISATAAAVASLVAGVSTFRHKKSGPPAEKSSWGQTLGKVVGLVSTIWSAFHTRRKLQPEFSGGEPITSCKQNQPK